MLSFVVTLVVLLLTVGYLFYHARVWREGSCCKKYGPVTLAAIGALLIMADPMRHFLHDNHWWYLYPKHEGDWFPGSAMYYKGCEEEAWHCLSVVGILFTLVFTYLGFILLTIGTMWNADIVAKLKNIKAQWKELRS